MRDKHDRETADIWPVAAEADALTRLPRARVHGTCIVLVDHPHIPPIGFGELARLGSVLEVLRERMRCHQGEAYKHSYYSSPELPARRTREELRHSVLVIRYRDAIQDFKRVEGEDTTWQFTQ